MAYVDILDSQTDAGSPLDQQLMDTINHDFDDHESRILALEAGGGSGGTSTNPADDPRYGSIIAGLQTNEAYFKRKRYHISQSIINNGEKLNNLEGFDPEGTDESRWENTEDGAIFTTNALSNDYLGYHYTLPKGNSWSFKLKKGENFFGIGSVKSSVNSNTVRVYIDGLSVTGFGGVVDENGAARSDSYSGTSSSTIYYATQWFFGFDGEEHLITILNDDSGTNVLNLNFIDIGYASKHGTHAVDLDLKVNAGRASIRGIVTNTNETTLSFDSTNGYGRTDALVSTNAGTLSILKGVEPAMTQLRPETVSFSTSLTSLKPKNAYFFPSSGFLLVSHPNGSHYMASYTSKTTTTIAQHSFNGVLWQSKPKEDYDPLSGFTSTTNFDSKGDININLWAAGGHIISSSNNKLDFKVTLNGTQTTHAATIVNGLYSADIVPLGRAIVDAMKAVKPLSNGEYFAEYNPSSLRWTIGVKGSEVSELQLLFNTGSNFANSIHSTLGYTNNDLSAATSYMSSNSVNSSAHKVFEQDAAFMTANDPRHAYSAADGAISFSSIEYIKQRLGIGYVRTVQADNFVTKIYPDKDCTGLSVSYLGWGGEIMMSIDIDYGHHVLFLNPEATGSDVTSTRRNIYSGFVSFPRGSHVITLRPMSSTGFEIDTSTQQFTYLGARQYFCKPKIEALSSSQSILKCFDISPKQFFKTLYSSDYAPQATKDNIDTITRTGTWSSGTGLYNNAYYQTSTINDTLDITFTLQGDGGGIGVSASFLSGDTNLVECYLVSGASASETSTLITNVNHNGAYLTNYFAGEVFQIMGLTAGQYTLRLKNKENSRFIYDWISIVDTVAPDRGQTTSDLTNTGQAVSFPLNGIYFNVQFAGHHMTPNYLVGSGFNEGKSFINLGWVAPSAAVTQDDTVDVVDYNVYFSAWGSNDTSDDIGFFYFGKSFFILNESANTGHCQVVQPVIDGVNHGNTFSCRVNAKGGGGPASVGYFVPHFNDHFLRYGTSMTNSTTLPISNTKGLRVGSTIILEADSQPTLKRVVATVTADTSITFTEAVSGFSSYTTANNVRVKSYGFHNIKFENDDGNFMYTSALCVEPMDIQQSNHLVRRASQSKIGEVVTILFRLIPNNGDIYYPYFSDGRQATYMETSIDIVAFSNASQVIDIPYDLKNIQISAGTIDIKLTSIRRY